MAVQGHGAGRDKGHARRRPLTARRARDTGAPPPRHSAAAGQQGQQGGSRARPARRDTKIPLAVGAAGLALLVAAVLGVQALGGDDATTDVAASTRDGTAQDQRPSTTSPSAAASAAPSTASSTAPAAAPRTMLPVVQAATGADRTPATARTALEQLLAGRALVTTRLLRATVRDDVVIGAAAAGVLDGTARDIGAVTRAYRGEALAAELEGLLDEQAQAAVSFAEGVRDGDEAATRAAADDLEETSARLGASLESATGGAVKAIEPREDAGQLRAYVSAQSKGDHAAAYAVERQLQARLGRQGSALATSLAGPVDPAGATSQQQELAARWQLLFGEHAVLAGDVVRAGLTGADDFEAATAALDANTAALTSAVGGVVPPEQAKAFSTMWADQLDAAVGYARATSEQDAAGRAQARERLVASGQALTTFFSDATGGRLSAASLGPALERHASALLGQADAWAASDAGKAYGLAAADYAGLAGLATPAAGAFAQTVAAEAPVGGAATGAGGASALVQDR